MRGIEADNPVRGDFHLFPCSRIAALAAFPPDNVQRPDAAQDAPLALGNPNASGNLWAVTTSNTLAST